MNDFKQERSIMNDLSDERAAFEAWFRDDYFCGLDDAGAFDESRRCYFDLRTQVAWKAWQRRAAIADRALNAPAQQAEPVTKEWVVNMARREMETDCDITAGAEPQGIDALMAPSSASLLSAMARNYRGGHAWDRLDSGACERAAKEITALRSALAAALANPREGWQPIETAPKNTDVLLYYPRIRGRRDWLVAWITVDTIENIPRQATHWMPLPAAPLQEGAMP